jgi:hypothetical protein
MGNVGDGTDVSKDFLCKVSWKFCIVNSDF